MDAQGRAEGEEGGAGFRWLGQFSTEQASVSLSPVQLPLQCPGIRVSFRLA